MKNSSLRSLITASVLIGHFLISSAYCKEVIITANPIRIYLLGEIHDNPNVHTTRLEFLKDLINQGQMPILAMEQFDREDQQKLDLALENCNDTGCVIEKVGSRGWDWPLYKPLIQLALDKKLSIIAVNLSNEDVSKVVSKGFSSVYSPDFINHYELNNLPKKLIRIQNKAIHEGHCGMLPASTLPGMTKGQIARDVWMANVIQNNSQREIVLIAGNGHVRKDSGVYHWLTTEQKKQTQVVGFIEQKETSGRKLYDRTILVKGIDREDFCQVFKKP